MQIDIAPQGSATIAIPAGEKIAVYTNGSANLYQVVGYPNHPDTVKPLTTVVGGQYVSSAFAAGATLILEAGSTPASYEVGTSPVVGSRLQTQYQGDPATLNATGTLTATAILGGIVTSSTAAAVAATLDTGPTVDLASFFSVGDSFDWSVINTGPNTFTVTASSGHTIVGVGAVVTATSGNFRTRKTAADTFITYRLA